MARSIRWVLYTVMALVITLPGQGQSVVQPVNVVLPCCTPPLDSVDIGLDGTYDFQAYWLGGIDNVQSYLDPIPSNLRFAYPVNAGDPYGTFWGNALLTQTTIACFWSNWLPNSGVRYVGFQRVNAPADTTFGWVEVDFYGDPGSCTDTVALLQLAYNSTPNVPLPAGSLVTGIDRPFGAPPLVMDFMRDELVITGTVPASAELLLRNAVGQVLVRRALHAQGDRVPLEGLRPGLYVATVQDPRGATSVRFVR
ncbi:MAG: hypothetical protein H6597_05445 [Flavobacteriales bacterium]|nr:hypothetical protein [Flavobacteriales bacterium]MCB9193960.1 hypothetical protein [Flavobacteriales bacterium]